MTSKPYLMLADELAAQIATGELPMGYRLPPQREFAYTRGISVSTASRVYEELGRRGLVVGEVGRGTFVSNRFVPLDQRILEPSNSGVDLEIVFQLASASRATIRAGLISYFKSGMTSSAYGPPAVRGLPELQMATARIFSEADPAFVPDQFLFTGTGKQALAASLAALAPRGGRVGIEALTYPYAISAARILGIDLVPLELDNEGIVPASLDKAASIGLSAVYLQPRLQSPLVLTMSPERLDHIAGILDRHSLTAIEDRVYAFLDPGPSLASRAPCRVVQIDSLSKRLMPGLALGIIAAPSSLYARIATAIRSGGWMAPAMAQDIARYWIETGILREVELTKRTEAKDMFDIAMSILAPFGFKATENSMHGWLPVPPGLRSDDFAGACARVGVAVAPGQLFSVTPGTSPQGVRIAFSAPDYIANLIADMQDPR